MLDAAQRLVSASVRSDVPPFMVMDVMAAAARLEEQGRRVIHMEVGQPAASPPTSALAAARAALAGRIAYTESLGIPSLRARIARHYGEIYGVEVDPGANHRHDGLLGRLYPGIPCLVRGRRPGRAAGARVSAVAPHPHGARLRGRADRDLRRVPLGADRRDAARRPSQDPTQRRAGGKPSQSDRHHDDRRCFGRAHRG